MVWSIEGKTVVVTGASSGIGKMAALELARRGARLVLLCRNPQKASEVANEAKSIGRYEPGVVIADMASLAEIRRAADEIKQTHERIDVLINNAGAFHSARTATLDGYETTFAVNHLGYFLLTDLLLDRLKKSAPARIVNVASHAHRRGTIKFDDLQRTKWNGGDAYAQSKLANILFSNELAHRLEGSGVTSNALHPGVVATRFAAGTGGPVGLFFKVFRPLLRSESDGAKTTVHLACGPELPIASGGYYADERPSKQSKEAGDAAIAKRLWEVSEKLVASK